MLGTVLKWRYAPADFRFMRVIVAAAAAACVAAALSGQAAASQVIEWNATGVKLAANQKGEALLTYRVRGRTMRVLVWGAVDEIAGIVESGAYERHLGATARF